MSNTEAAPVQSTEVAQEAPQVAQPSQPTPTPVEDGSNMSARFAALARKERSLREQEDKLKQEREYVSKYKDLDVKAKEDPLYVLQQYGLDLDTVIAAALGKEKAPPSVEQQIQELKEEMERAKQEQLAQVEAKKKQEEDAYQQGIEEAILAHRNSITELLGQQKEKYELINLHAADELVWEVTEAYFQENGKVLTPDEAADKVEAYLEEQTRKALALARFKPKTEEAQVQGALEAIMPNPKKESPTLTSEMVATAPVRSVAMSAEESKRKAAELLRWK